MQRILFIISLLISSYISYGQYTLQYEFSDLSFENNFERLNFKNLDSSSINYFNLFLSISDSSENTSNVYHENFDQEIEILKNRKVHRKFSKDIENIYEHIHDHFLNKYEPISYFKQIFTTGTYNCVSAVALYALVLNELDIEYNIKETPTHVYLIVDPSNEQLLLETTDPVKGFSEFSNGFKENFVNTLSAQKLISESELVNGSINSVFDKYYFGGKTLNLKELASLQYYNKGVTALAESDYNESYKQLAKAYYIYPNEKTQELLMVSITNILNQSNYENWRDIQLLTELEKFIGKDINVSNVEGEIARMIQNILIERGNIKLADSAYNYTINNISDSTLLGSIKFMYNYEIAVVHYNKSNYSEAYKSAKIAYELKPKHIHTASLLLQCFILNNENKDEELVLQEFIYLTDSLPKLLLNKKYAELKNNLYLAAMYKALEKNKLNKAESYRKNFESWINDNRNISFDPNLLGNAYSLLSLAYFKKGYTSKAKVIVQKGLSYDKENYQLKSARRMLYN